jgi:hypothetical protein
MAILTVSNLKDHLGIIIKLFEIKYNLMRNATEPDYFHERVFQTDVAGPRWVLFKKKKNSRWSFNFLLTR